MSWSKWMISKWNSAVMDVFTHINSCCLNSHPLAPRQSSEMCVRGGLVLNLFVIFFFSHSSPPFFKKKIEGSDFTQNLVRLFSLPNVGTVVVYHLYRVQANYIHLWLASAGIWTQVTSSSLNNDFYVQKESSGSFIAVGGHWIVFVPS